MAVENQFSTVIRVLYGQCLVMLVVSSGFGFSLGWKAALSPFLGCWVALIPNAYFAFKVYLARHRSANAVLNAFYTGETVKLLLTAGLFALVLQIPSVNFLLLLVGYVAVLSVFWFALFYWRV